MPLLMASAPARTSIHSPSQRRAGHHEQGATRQSTRRRPPLASPAMRPAQLLTGLATAALLTACGSGAPAPAATAPAPPAASSAPAASPDILTADDVPADSRAAYLTGLTKIDPGLTVNEDRAIRRATDICVDITQGKDEGTVVSNTVSRLSGGNATINTSQAADAVALARAHICR